MPILTFKCKNGHTVERIVSFTEEETTTHALCMEMTKDGPTLDDRDYCGDLAERVDFMSPPLPAHFYGNPDGYHKPSPTKRYNTKLVSQKTGNRDSVG